MSNAPDYLKPYQEAVEAHGGTFDATLWRSKEGQALRFKVFCDFIDFNDCSILDVGCGIGDFADYLVKRDVSFSTFHGVDAMEAMVKTAMNRNLAKSTFTTADVLRTPNFFRGDWITFSGTLNAMDETAAMKLIDDAFDASSKGVAFNFLSNQSGREPKSEDLSPAARFNTTAWVEHAFTLTPNVDFTQSYLHGHDATIVLRK